MLRPDRHRRALGPGRAARGDAAVPRRRLDDRDGDDGAARRSPPPPARFEAGTPPIAEAIALGAAVDYLTALGMRGDPVAREGADRVRAGRPRDRARAADLRPDRAGRPRRHDLVRARRHPPARRRPGARRRGRRGAGGSPLRPAGRAPASACRRRPAPRSTSTRRPRRSTRWCAASNGCGRCSADAAGPALPGDHPGPLQAPARARAARAVRRRGAPREPDLRRRGHDPGRGRRTP